MFYFESILIKSLIRARLTENCDAYNNVLLNFTIKVRQKGKAHLNVGRYQLFRLDV